MEMWREFRWKCQSQECIAKPIWIVDRRLLYAI